MKFCDRRMSDDDQLEFLQYIEYSVTGKRNKKRHVDITSFDSTVEFQLKSLPLTERNELIRLLTHKLGEEDDDDVINEEMLTLLPSLQNRSMSLLEKNARKQRADKIDLKFISDFMYDYCRYDRVHHKLIICQTIITTLTSKKSGAKRSSRLFYIFFLEKVEQYGAIRSNTEQRDKKMRFFGGTFRKLRFAPYCSA